jgi:hypothetical protein
MKTEQFRPVDKNGKPLEVGDRIRVLGFHSRIVDTRKIKTRTILEQCVGRVFSITDVQKDWAAMEVGKFVGRPACQETIYIQPEHMEPSARRNQQLPPLTKDVQSAGLW